MPHSCAAATPVPVPHTCAAAWTAPAAHAPPKHPVAHPPFPGAATNSGRPNDNGSPQAELCAVSLLEAERLVLMARAGEAPDCTPRKVRQQGLVAVAAGVGSLGGGVGVVVAAVVYSTKGGMSSPEFGFLF